VGEGSFWKFRIWGEPFGIWGNHSAGAGGTAEGELRCTTSKLRKNLILLKLGTESLTFNL
jgi:hypothetical protein